MRIRHGVTMCLGVLMIAYGGCQSHCPPTPTATPCPTSPCLSPNPMPLICNWGVAPHAPTLPHEWPNSTQVMMMPVVMDFGDPPFGSLQVAFISFETANDANRDGGGVLRIIDENCNEIARFPDTSIPPPPIPVNGPSNLNTVPRLACVSGVAVGQIDGTADVQIIAVLDDPNGTNNHFQIIAFNLVGPLPNPVLVPKWCSPPLPTGDPILGTSAPAIAQLDDPNSLFAQDSEIIIDNKVFESNGTLRFSGGATGPRSRTVAVANVSGTPLPQVITGNAVYTSSAPAGPKWTGSLAWQNPNVGTTSLVYPAVAELDINSPGPEIVVTDTMANTLFVLSAAGTTLASILLPVPGCPGANCPCPGTQCPKCGGPPMIGDIDGLPGLHIGVASCSQYTLFRYNPGLGTLSVVWSAPTNDPSGQTAASLAPFHSGIGPMIYYADSDTLWVFDAANGNVLKCAPNANGTAIESPVIAGFPGGRVIVAANDYSYGGAGCQKGVQIFDAPNPLIGYRNQQEFHETNVLNSSGAIPKAEPPSWFSYRAQH